MNFKEKLQQTLENSRFTAELEKIKHRREKILSESRPLKESEIAHLKAQNNYCHDWSLISVHNEFRTETVRGNIFTGSVYLGVFIEGKASAISSCFYEGIFNSSINNSIIDSHCAVYFCSAISNAFINSNSAVSNSAVINNQNTMCATGVNAETGPETGEREIPLIQDLNMHLIKEILSSDTNRFDYIAAVREFCEKLKTSGKVIPFTGRNCKISDTRIENSIIFHDTRIAGAALISNCTIMGSEEEPARLGTSVQAKNSIIQEGTECDSGAVIDSSLLMEHCKAERNCLINSSIVGPNSSIGEGEITSSIVGPFTAAHHHSMVIATIWPSGRGNVGYGANIGSNHTSRMPDQELFPGEGMFWGLGCSIKYPGNYIKAPYSIVSTGVTTLPQKVEFPFSLINQGDGTSAMSPAINEIIPAWVLSDNVYAVFRNEAKYRKRNKARRDHFDFTVLNYETVLMMREARKRLKNIKEEMEFYTEREIPGLGKNYLTEKNRTSAIETYSKYIRYYCLKSICHRMGNLISCGMEAKDIEENLFSKSECTLEDRELLKLYTEEKLDRSNLKKNLEEYITILKHIFDDSYKSRQKDFHRGSRIIDDYAMYHSPPEGDTFLKELKEEFTVTEKRVAQFLDILCNG